MVRVLGKGGKERLVPFNTSTATAIRAYLKDRERSCAAGPARAGAYAAAAAGPARPAAAAAAIRCS